MYKATALLLVAALLCGFLLKGVVTPDAAQITVDPGQTYQTITGWEAVAQAGELACETADFLPGDPRVCPAFKNYQAELLNRAVNELGINRLRVEVLPGVENPTDYFAQYLDGMFGERDWVHIYGPQFINDNGDPGSANSSGFHFTSFDHEIDTIVLPMRQRLQTRGENLFINVCYVDFSRDAGAVHHYQSPQEYAEFVLATYQHMQSKYGFVPDAWEVILEPDNTDFNGTRIGQAIQATIPRLEAAGFDPSFVVPSTTDMGRAPAYFEAIRAVIGDEAVRRYIREISYHRYGVSETALQWIGNATQTYGIGSAMLEHIASGYEDLHADLKTGRNTAWQQYTLAYPGNPDDGKAYYVINDSNPSQPAISAGSRTTFLRQYFAHIRSGAQRIGATSSDGGMDPLAFINSDGGYVAVIKAGGAGTASVQGLPAGRYGMSYTTAAAANVQAPPVNIGPGESLSTSIPAAGVLTVYALPGEVGTATPTLMSTVTRTPTATRTATVTRTTTATRTPTGTKTTLPTPTATQPPAGTKTPTPTPSVTPVRSIRIYTPIALMVRLR